MSQPSRPYSPLVPQMLALWLLTLLCGCAQPAPQPAADPSSPPPPATSATQPAAQGAQPNPTQPAVATVTSATASAPTAAPTTAAAPTNASTAAPISVWLAAPEDRSAAMAAWLAATARAGGIELRVTAMSSDGLVARMATLKLGGDAPPDAIVGSEDDLALLQHDGAIVPLGGGPPDSALLPATVIGATRDGVRWGVPLAARGGLLLFGNRRFVAALPATTDALIADARRQVNDEHYGLVAGWAEARWFAAYVHGFGGALYDASGTPTLDTPAVRSAIDLLRAMRTAGPPPPSSYAQGNRLFRRGGAAYALDGDWALTGYRDYTDTLDLIVAPLPQVDATGRAMVGPLGGYYLMLSQQTDAARAQTVMRLGELLSATAAQRALASDAQLLPAQRTLLADVAVLGNPALAALAQSALEAPGIPPRDGVRCAWAAVSARLPDVILGDTRAADAPAAMQQQAMTCLGNS